MRLESLTLAGFRNLADARLDLPPEGVALVGRNAQGKSNFLEAIHYLDTFRSFRRARDEQLVRSGGDVFRVHASLATDDGARRSVAAAYQQATGRKRVTLDDAEVERLADAIGLAGTVLFTPDDVALVSGGPDERRRFLDVLLSLNAPGYLGSLQRYKNALSQRNAALREQAPPASIRAWDGLLVDAGSAVVAARANWVESHADRLADRYRRIAGEGVVTMRYDPSISGGAAMTTVEGAADAFGEALDRSRSLEARRRTTVVGPHRDEVTLLFGEDTGEKDLRQFGSGGERRTAALALRLTEADTRRATLDEDPILLLDDVFAELDEERSARIAHMIDEALPGQVFVAVPKETDIKVRADWLPEMVYQQRKDLDVSRSARGADERPRGHPERIGSLLGKALDRLGITGEVASQAALSRWDEVVGDAIAQVTRPKAVSNGVLFVEVASSGWLTELNLMRRDILARLNAGQREGRVERVVFTMAENLSGGHRRDRSE